jgi:uncharacterized Zn finger protein (UPF0148 family)
MKQYQCPDCDHLMNDATNFCPSCGAKFDAVQQPIPDIRSKVTEIKKKIGELEKEIKGEVEMLLAVANAVAKEKGTKGQSWYGGTSSQKEANVKWGIESAFMSLNKVFTNLQTFNTQAQRLVKESY